MKTTKFFYLIALMVAFTSCLSNNDDIQPTYMSPLGTVVNPTVSNLFTLVGDDGFQYIVTETNYPDFKPETDTRVALVFNLLNQNDQTKQIEVRMMGGTVIKTLNLLPGTKAVTDTVGNDPVYKMQMYIANRFLNVNFAYTLGSVKHSFNMVRDSIIAENSDTIKLTFCHNAHNDLGLEQYNTLCFDISELQEFSANPDSIPVVVYVNEYGQTTPKKFNLMYKF